MENPSTAVDIVVRLIVEGSREDVAPHLEALHNLGEVMATQAEDGLWSLGSPEVEDEAGPSVYVADVHAMGVRAVQIDDQPGSEPAPTPAVEAALLLADDLAQAVVSGTWDNLHRQAERYRQARTAATRTEGNQ